MKKRLLFWCGSLSSIQVLLRVAAKAAACYEPIFLVGGAAGESTPTIAAVIERHGFAVWKTAPAGRRPPSKAFKRLHSHCVRAHIMRLAIWLLRPRTGPNPHVANVHAQIADADDTLGAIDPAAVVVAEDGISGPLDLLTAIHRRRIPLVDVPFGFGVRRDLELDLIRKVNSGEAHWAAGPYGTWIRALAPQWISRGSVEGALPFVPAYVAALIATGIRLRDPWIIHGGLSDRLCAESDKTVALYRSEGVPERKIRLTGSPYCDVMADALGEDEAARAAFRHPRPIDAVSMRILVSWPPSYHDTRVGTNEFATYEEMTRTVLGFLRDLPDCALTVSLHPAADPDTRKLIEADGITVSDEYVVRAIPRHDIFVTYFSSTIRWAIAAGKPVVNYDAYRLGLQLYDTGGFFSESTFHGFRARVSELVSVPDAFRTAARAQIAEADKWGVVDGQAAARIVSVLDELTS